MEIRKDILNQIRSIVTSAQTKAVKAVDQERVLMYCQIGKLLFEEEQQGENRAAYGTFLIKSISSEFQRQFGTGFSVRQLERYRLFFRMFSIASALRTQFSWTHYKLLLSIYNEDKRLFYFYLDTVKSSY